MDDDDHHLFSRLFSVDGSFLFNEIAFFLTILQVKFDNCYKRCDLFINVCFMYSCSITL